MNSSIGYIPLAKVNAVVKTEEDLLRDSLLYEERFGFASEDGVDIGICSCLLFDQLELLRENLECARMSQADFESERYWIPTRAPGFKNKGNPLHSIYKIHQVHRKRQMVLQDIKARFTQHAQASKEEESSSRKVARISKF